jgi:hypothetical protein
MKKIVPIFFLVLVGLTRVFAQDVLCTPDIGQFLSESLESCTNLSTGMICYGGGDIQLSSGASDVSAAFKQAGDAVSVSDIETITLTSGSAIIRLPFGTSTDSTNYLIFGNITLQNLITGIPLPLPPSLTITMNTNANVRDLPSTEGLLLTSLKSGSKVSAVGRSEDNQWVRILLPDTPDQAGWVFVELINTSGDLETLNTAVADDPVPNFPSQLPMQVIEFQTTADEACTNPISGGIIVQTPHDDQSTTLDVNGYQLSLTNATAVLQGSADEMRITQFEGFTTIQKDDLAHFVAAGTQIQLSPDDTESILPTAYEIAPVGSLPLDRLTRPIEAAEPLSETDLEQLWIEPLPGNWRAYNPLLSDNCGNMSSSDPTLFSRVTLAIEDDGDTIHLSGQIDRDMFFSKTSPGVYHTDLFGTSLELHVASPIRIESQYENVYSTDPKRCAAIYGFNLEWEGSG